MKETGWNLKSPIGWGSIWSIAVPTVNKSDSDLNSRQKKDGPATAADGAVNRNYPRQPKSRLAIFRICLRQRRRDAHIWRRYRQLKDSWVWIIVMKWNELTVRTDWICNSHCLKMDDHTSVSRLSETEKLYMHKRWQYILTRTRDSTVQPIWFRNTTKWKIWLWFASHYSRINDLINCWNNYRQKNLNMSAVLAEIVTIIEQEADIYNSISTESAPQDWDMAAQN